MVPNFERQRNLWSTCSWQIRHSFWGLHYERCRCTLLIRPWNVFEKLKGEKLPGTKQNNQLPRAMFVTFQNHQVLRLFQGVYYFLLYRDNYIKKRTPLMGVTCFHSRPSEREWTKTSALFAGADLVPGCFQNHTLYGWIIFWIHHIICVSYLKGQKWPGSFWRNLPFLNRSFLSWGHSSSVSFNCSNNILYISLNVHWWVKTAKEMRRNHHSSPSVWKESEQAR